MKASQGYTEAYSRIEREVQEFYLLICCCNHQLAQKQKKSTFRCYFRLAWVGFGFFLYHHFIRTPIWRRLQLFFKLYSHGSSLPQPTPPFQPQDPLTNKLRQNLKHTRNYWNIWGHMKISMASLTRTILKSDPEIMDLSIVKDCKRSWNSLRWLKWR